jgi:hypothetical protein
MALRSHLSTVLLAATAALAGCAGKAPPDKGTDILGASTAPTASEVVDRLGRLECDAAFACKASFPTDQGSTFDQTYGADAAACYADQASYYDARALEASIAAGTIEFDPTAAESCVSDLASIDTVSCPDMWDTGVELPDACSDVFAGTLDDGEACTNDFECAGDASVCSTDSKTCEAETTARTAPRDRGLADHPKLERFAR